jgi:hypothetical protein
MQGQPDPCRVPHGGGMYAFGHGGAGARAVGCCLAGCLERGAVGVVVGLPEGAEVGLGGGGL